MTDSPCQSDFVSKNTKIQSFFDLEKGNELRQKICCFFFDKYWNKFFDSKSWITILNMKLKLEQIETLEIRSERKLKKKKKTIKSRKITMQLFTLVI